LIVDGSWKTLDQRADSDSLRPRRTQAAMFSGHAALSLRPAFVGWNVLAARLWLWGYLASIFGAAGTILTSLIYRTDGGISAFIAFTALGLLIAPFPIYAVARLSYARTEYQIYPDRLEFEQGFFVAKKKVILFRDIQEVTLQQGLAQRMCGLGTINLSTQATGTDDPGPFARFGFIGGSQSGASLQDIPNPDETFETVKKMVGHCRR
jgi:membrane protein YdbS with pleckstrin-like domain